MRWKLKITPSKGSRKIARKFLWFPICLEDECRWLEYATLLYEYQEVLISYDMGGVTGLKWIPIKFIDDE